VLPTVVAADAAAGRSRAALSATSVARAGTPY
jgi:hypothetical protein